jgi:hypothetical protein
MRGRDARVSGVALLRIETAVFVSEIGSCDFE